MCREVCPFIRVVPLGFHYLFTALFFVCTLSLTWPSACTCLLESIMGASELGIRQQDSPMTDIGGFLVFVCTEPCFIFVDILTLAYVCIGIRTLRPLPSSSVVRISRNSCRIEGRRRRFSPRGEWPLKRRETDCILREGGGGRMGSCFVLLVHVVVVVRRLLRV